MCLSLKKFHVPKNSMGYAKKRKKMSMPKCMREKKCMLKSMKKRKKERKKDSPYFQNKGIHSKERD